MDHEAVTDRPSSQSGRELEYGSLGANARRSLTAQEIAWNNELIRAEAATAVPRGSASAASRARPAAATAPALGSESVGTQATPAASTALALGSESVGTPATPASATAPTLGSAGAETPATPPAATSVKAEPQADTAKAEAEIPERTAKASASELNPALAAPRKRRGSRPAPVAPV